MTISVLMSTYIKEKPEYLDVAIQSIWENQSRKPDQLVLVEDGPLTQELQNVVNKWKRIIGNKFAILANEQNKGLALSLNDGIAAATGELIARMDSDDIAMPNRLELEEAYMKAHEDVAILGGGLQEFNDIGTLDKIRLYPLSMKEIKKSIHKASPLGHPTVMFRRSFFDAGYKYSNKYYICEDIELWFKAIADGYIINNLPDILLKFRRNDAMLNRRGRQKAWSELLVYTHGIYKINGILTLKFLFPIMRFTFRLMPTFIIKAAYNSRLRKIITK